jgi:hypothetical protein
MRYHLGRKTWIRGRNLFLRFILVNFFSNRAGLTQYEAETCVVLTNWQTQYTHITENAKKAKIAKNAKALRPVSLYKIDMISLVVSKQKKADARKRTRAFATLKIQTKELDSRFHGNDNCGGGNDNLLPFAGQSQAEARATEVAATKTLDPPSAKLRPGRGWRAKTNAARFYGNDSRGGGDDNLLRPTDATAGRIAYPTEKNAAGKIAPLTNSIPLGVLCVLAVNPQKNAGTNRSNRTNRTNRTA